MTINVARLVRGDEGLGARGSGLSNVLRPCAANPESRALGLGGRDTPELKKAFTDFVGQTFFGELLKQMRASVDKPAFFHGGMGEDIFQSQLDQILVERITDASGPSFSDPMYQLLMARRS
jgi:peptidoglycan hydrolase FlgJ